jgi:hypothetical protein
MTIRCDRTVYEAGTARTAAQAHRVGRKRYSGDKLSVWNLTSE